MDCWTPSIASVARSLIAVVAVAGRVSIAFGAFERAAVALRPALAAICCGLGGICLICFSFHWLF